MLKLTELLTTIKQQMEGKEDSYVSSDRGFYVNSYYDAALVTEFKKTFFSLDCNQDSWIAKRTALELALVLFGSQFGTWCRKSTQLGSYYRRSDEFLEDTINFIHTGKREMSVDNWKPLLETSEALHKAGQLYRVKRERFSYPVAYPMSECLSRWCAHHNGLQDMVCTLDILFGEMTVNADKHCESEMKIRVLL